MTAEGGSLSSDHVNYLILRYLQEAGHGKAAEELYRSWNRPYECRDPEDYTFARTVHRNDLISLIQDGLVYDELLASAAQGQKRYAFVNPELSAHDEGFVDGERQSSKRVPIHAPADDFPTPAAKRQRLSHGSEAQMNGDTSEADADGEEVDEMEVEDEEVEPVEVERYDSMDVATQTTPPPKLGPKHKITAVQWALDEEYASVLHASWATGKHGQTETLFMGGENVCKFYDVPENAEDMEQIAYFEPPLPSNTTVTASTWHPSGSHMTLAVDTLRKLPDGREEPWTQLMGFGPHTGSRLYDLGPQLLAEPAIITKLLYSPDGKLLLAVSGNSKRGLVLVLDTSNESEPGSGPPVAWRIFERPVLDACWTGDVSFAVVGEDPALRLFTIDLEEDSQSEDGMTAEKIQLYGLRESFAVMDNGSGRDSFEKVLYDRASDLIVPAAIDSGETWAIHSASLAAHLVQRSGRRIEAISLRPRQNTLAREHQAPQLLAVLHDDGECVVYRLDGSEGVPVCSVERILSLPGGTGLTLAWTPSGRYLALVGTDIIKVWDTFGEDTVEEVASWHLPSQAEDSEEEEDIGVTVLSWDASGKRLCWAKDRQTAIITFDPPLAGGDITGDARVEINGS